MNNRPSIELLAPARNAAVARTALLHGADAVYMGAMHHGARASAGNSVADIASVVRLAHTFGARVYVTVNTLVYDNELAEVERMVRDLYRAGVDALIVQDMGLLRLDLPPIALHASTQCDIRTPEKARFLADVGFSQLVVPRESTLEETAAIAAAVPGTAIEAFCHGALCVSYSGDCQASLLATGRSANRGECAQLCRLPYDLTDGRGNVIMARRHLLSLRDLNRADLLPDMLAAGVTSFKIEGRLKDEAYVKNVVGAYSRLLDEAIAAMGAGGRRLSAGTCRLTFTPDLGRSFNRGYTSYFMTPRPVEPMGSHLTPKSTGVAVGVTTAPVRDSRLVTARLDTPLANGDGLGFYGPDGTFSGFRLNRVDGNRLTAATPVSIPRGTTLWRNRDKEWDDRLAGDTARRTIAVDMTLREAPAGYVTLDLLDETGVRVSLNASAALEPSRSPQHEPRRRALSKTGDTVFTLRGLDDRLGDRFVAPSILAALRRDALTLLLDTRLARHRFDRRRAEDRGAKAPARLTYHDNVANEAARRFYTDHGARSIEPALEAMDARERAALGNLRVMTTRYCLRRELGACLLTPSGPKLPADLRLRAPGIDLKLEFDCRQCRMHVTRT